MKIKNLSFKFTKNSEYFFKDLTINFESNQLNFLQGKNGVGKSTLFNIVLGNTEYNTQLQGIIEIKDHAYEIQNNKVSNELSKQIKLVQQQFDRMLAHNFSFNENLQLASLPAHPKLCSLPQPPNLPAMIENLNIGVDTPVKLLSGGQRQILAICMALQKPTNVLLLDEPTAALDEKNANMVLTFLQQLTQERELTILIISHDKELVTRYAKHGYFHMVEEDGIRRIEKIG